jgi:hypothetical protein
MLRPSYSSLLHLCSHSLISGSTVFLRTLPLHTGGIVIYLHIVGLLWTSDQPFAKASTSAGQHNTKKRTNNNFLSGIRNHDLSVQAIKSFAADRTATETGSLLDWLYIWWRLKIMELLFIKLSPTSCHFSLLLFGNKSPFFPHLERPGLIPIQNNRQNYSFTYFNLYVFRQRTWKQNILNSVCY